MELFEALPGEGHAAHPLQDLWVDLARRALRLGEGRGAGQELEHEDAQGPDVSTVVVTLNERHVKREFCYFT